MKPLYLSLITCCLTVTLKAQSFSDYQKLNAAEQRLMEYKDSDDMLRLKIQQLEVINNSRKKYKAPPVKLDILASRVANKQCKEAAEGDFKGHWNLRGEKPYHRYAFAGGKDHITENASATWIEGGTFDGQPGTYSKFMVNLHGEFMAEKAPYDGHKQAIIQKDHTHVGIGAYMTDKQFRYYEEFVDRYADIGEVPAVVKANETFNIEIKPFEGRYVFYASANYEKVPKAMSRGEVNRKSSYPDYTESTPVRYAPWDLAKYRSEDGSYTIPWTFSKKGLYYIKILVDDKDPANLRSFSTEGKTVATGIVVRVE